MSSWEGPDAVALSHFTGDNKGWQKLGRDPISTWSVALQFEKCSTCIAGTALLNKSFLSAVSSTQSNVQLMSKYAMLVVLWSPQRCADNRWIAKDWTRHPWSIRNWVYSSQAYAARVLYNLISITDANNVMLATSRRGLVCMTDAQGLVINPGVATRRIRPG